MAVKDDVLLCVAEIFGLQLDGPGRLSAAPALDQRGAVGTEVWNAIQNCDADGVVTKLKQAYEGWPRVVFEHNANTESGGYWDSVNKKIHIDSQIDTLMQADVFLFESFNCYYDAEFRALDVAFKRAYGRPMFFMDYGRKKSDIEAKSTFAYVSLWREVQRNHAAHNLPRQATRALRANKTVAHEDQAMCVNSFTPHDPSGTGDFQFATPRHYAFQRMMDLEAREAMIRMKHLIVNAASRNGKARDYTIRLDPDPHPFQKWWSTRWPAEREKRPTAFISVCVEANQYGTFKARLRRGEQWKPITLADFQFDVGMELEARRLAKKSPIAGKP